MGAKCGQHSHDRLAILSRSWRNCAQEILAWFMDTVLPEDDIFRSYADRIASDMGVELVCEEAYENLFSSLAELPSFCKKVPR